MLAIDFETFSSVNLKESSYRQYFDDPDYHPQLCAMYGERTGNLDLSGNKGQYLSPYLSQSLINETLDFIRDKEAATIILEGLILAAPAVLIHNKVFDMMALEKLYGPDHKMFRKVRFIDTAMLSRRFGGSSGLDSAARQWLDSPGKRPEGRRLLNKFSLCDKAPTERDILSDPDWDLYKDYALQDAELAYGIAKFVIFSASVSQVRRWALEQEVTDRMNRVGWPVDTESVKNMMMQQAINVEDAVSSFRAEYDTHGALNLNSFVQKKAFCLDRGVKAKSFDEDHVVELLTICRKRLEAKPSRELHGVIRLLETLSEVGGSSLKKLPVIQRLTDSDGRLRDQYLHCGAVQSLRTTGVGVQMQNLPRLGQKDLDFSLLGSEDYFTTNTELAGQIRKLFCAADPDGQLIVGDFASIESRGLAALAGANWKLKSYREGRDLYKVLAAKHFHVDYDEVTAYQRGFGKVGELACGYGAGPESVRGFAAGMGITLSSEEASDLVRGWRGSNQEIVNFWAMLDQQLINAMQGRTYATHVQYSNGFKIVMVTVRSPKSLETKHPGCKDLQITVCPPEGATFTRYFRGAYLRGRQVIYHKPNSKVSGDPWSDTFRDPKTKQMRHYTIYGGKLTGILTQSLCRELFFEKLQLIETKFYTVENLKIIGQFHDEIILEWVPPKPGAQMVPQGISSKRNLTIEQAVREFSDVMNEDLSWLPISSSIKFDRRYIK